MKFTKKIYFGKLKDSNERIYLSAPSWDCDWYWGFGYLGNANCHFRLSGYQTKNHHFTLKDDSFKFITEHRNKNMYNCLLEDYNLNPKIKDNLWVFCELIQTFYALKETTEVLGKGGSHYTNNPIKELILNKDEVARINKTVLPALFDSLYEILK